MGDDVNSTTQTKRATGAKSRKNAKKVKTYHAADWGDHNMNFLIPGTGDAQDACYVRSGKAVFKSCFQSCQIDFIPQVLHP